MKHHEDWLATAREASEAASAVQIRWAGRLGMDSAEVKGFGDFVSRADVEAQDAALAVIRGRHPTHRMLAEEGAAHTREACSGSTPIWVVDPLDGTKNFLHGHPFFAASVAVAVEGRPVAGSVVAAQTGERWWAVRGGGAQKNGRDIRVSSAKPLDRALVGTGFPFKSLPRLPGYLESFRRMVEAGAAVRRAGAAAIDLCYLAEGRFDAFWEFHLHPWDFAAGMLIVEEAGGLTSSVEGGPLELAEGSVAGANNGDLLEQLLSTVGQRPKAEE